MSSYNTMRAFLLIFLSLCVFAGAQPKTPREQIPAKATAEVKKQIERLYSSDFMERKNGAKKLGEMKAVEAIPFLIGLLHDNTVDVDNVTVGEESAKALYAIGKPAVEPLIEALKDPDFSVKSNAATALGMIGEQRAVEPLIDMFKTDISVLRFPVLESIIKINDPRITEFLIETSKKENVPWFHRIQSLRALGNIKDARAFNTLLEMLNNKDGTLRASSARALGETKNPSAVEPLLNALKDSYGNTRASAVIALGNLKDARAVEALVAMFNDTWEEIPPVAARSIAKIGQPAIGVLVTSLKNGNVTERIYSAMALGEIKSPEAVQPLIMAFKDKEISVRNSAEKALIAMDNMAVEPLINALKNEDVQVRLHSASALAELKKPQSVDALISLLKDENAEVRTQAVLALGGIRDAKAVEPLIECLKDQNADVQARAASALGSIGDKRAIEPLINALKIDNWELKYNASQALRLITGQDFGQDIEKWLQWLKQ